MTNEENLLTRTTIVENQFTTLDHNTKQIATLLACITLESPGKAQVVLVVSRFVAAKKCHGNFRCQRLMPWQPWPPRNGCAVGTQPATLHAG